ncbi:hypothetical protein [Glaciimonas sp. PAMC28666]|uniref:hypothetical protein n=1 Tax=Glaciimonas sp. PAMC28666 TaxID=2807626 RepID=UPI001962554C|nr:hypothetical protein [Glaciimonas sp. PAMC28666]QRX82237.1 hypothetical protein JQN73_19425 [Glaciimonas sp. PAMC28666]
MRLKYVLVVPEGVSEQLDVTPFQGWNRGVANPVFLSLLRILCCLPLALDEVLMTHDELRESRRVNDFKYVIAIGRDSLKKIQFVSIDEVTVFLCLPTHIKTVRETQNIKTGIALILSPTVQVGVIDVREIHEPFCHGIDNELWSVISCRSGKNSLQRKKYSKSVELPLLHGVVMPNIMLLENLGYVVIGEKGAILHDHEKAIDAVVATAEIVMDILCVEESSHKQEIVIYAPSVKVFFYDFKSNVWNQILRPIKESWKKKAIEHLLFKSKSYSSSTIRFNGDPLVNPYKDPVMGSLLAIRQSEIYATSMATAVLSCVQNIASVRLPNSINLHSSQLRQIENLSKRSDSKAEMLLQKAFHKYVSDLKDDVGDQISALICTRTRACKICSDVPLEWMYLGNLPLMISHEVSKLPMTPGNVLLRSATCGLPITLHADDLKKILIVRSFIDGDPIKPMLEFSINSFAIDEHLETKIVDVQSEKEAIQALNDFNGFVVIFDCHGDHGGSNSTGWLQFGIDRTNTWELAYKARIPPIVMLSACSTAPVGGSHASVANGLLRSGAFSVIGTFLPVNGAESSIFIARILYRISAYLPALKSIGIDLITWRTFIAGFMQMSYVTDVLRHFVKLGIIDIAFSQSVNLEANYMINLQQDDWYDSVIQKISEKTGIAADELIKKIVDGNPLLETMRYCHVGLPEHIRILLGDPIEGLKTNATH